MPSFEPTAWTLQQMAIAVTFCGFRRQLFFMNFHWILESLHKTFHSLIAYAVESFSAMTFHSSTESAKVTSLVLIHAGSHLNFHEILDKQGRQCNYDLELFVNFFLCYVHMCDRSATSHAALDVERLRKPCIKGQNSMCHHVFEERLTIFVNCLLAKSTRTLSRVVLRCRTEPKPNNGLIVRCTSKLHAGCVVRHF